MARYIFSVLVLSLLLPSSLLIPVPNANQEIKQVADEVQELESLRNEKTKPNDSNVKSTKPVVPQELKKDIPFTPEPSQEESQAKTKSAIFRHRGPVPAKKNKFWNEKPNEGYGKFPGIQYSPTDLAMYVFNTGDEEGVAVAVEELVREGLMGRTDAINYLQDVKQYLNYMKEMRDQLQANKLQEFENTVYPKPQLSQRLLPSIQRGQFLPVLDADKREPKPEPTVAVTSTTEQPRQVLVASMPPQKEPTDPASTTSKPSMETSQAANFKEEDFKGEIFKGDGLKEEDFKRRSQLKSPNDFSLEVIYKLAKDMFMQSILRDDPTAEETLSGLITFSENEVGNKHISPKMKEKVLMVVVSALVDALKEYQSYVSENRSYDEPGLYGHKPNGYSPKVAEMYRKLSADGQENMLQMTSKNRPKAS